MKRLSAVVGACVLTFGLFAQHWRAVGRGCNSPAEVQTLYGDSVSDRLLAGGTFLYMYNPEDTVLGVGQSAWNGTRWDSLAHRIQFIGGPGSAQQTYWYLRFGGELYACGGFSFQNQNGDWNSYLAKLNEDSRRWEDLGCLNSNLGGIQTLVPEKPQDQMFATGYSGELCGYPESCVYRYDGTNFHEWPPFQQIPYDGGNYVGLIFEFQDNMYMTGSFRDPYSEGIVTFMRHNGSEWEYVPGWNTSSPIKDISIRNDTLYVAGAFRNSSSGPGDLVAAFNGETWNDMGGGLRLTQNPPAAAALDLEWFHGELYVAGAFNRAADVNVQGLAKWNGHQWCSLPGYFYNTNFETFRIGDMTVWRDSLFICGGFTTVDGEPVRQVAQWIGGDQMQDCSAPVGIAEVAQELALVATQIGSTWRVQTPYTAYWRVLVSDASGRQLRTERVTNTFVLDLDHWASGIYVIQATDELGIRSYTKVWKEE